MRLLLLCGFLFFGLVLPLGIRFLVAGYFGRLGEKVEAPLGQFDSGGHRRLRLIE